MQATTRPGSRTTAVLAALAMALTMVVAAPGTARAHDSCAVAQPTATGFLASLMSFVNVFSSFLETEEVACDDKYEDVRAVMDRDWVAPAGAVDDEATSTGGRPDNPRANANERSNAPRTFAPCIDGMAAGTFACDGVDILSHVSMNELGLGQADVPAFVNDIWGWTDAATGDEYALLGSSEGTVFVDVSDVKRPEVLGIMPTASTAGGSSWRDIKVFDDHAFVVSEHTNHGVQVFDLTRLRDWDGDYTTYEPDARYTGHGSAHNININTDTGFAYSVGAGQFSSQPLPYTVRVDEGSAEGEYLANGAAFGATPDQAGVEADFSDVSMVAGNEFACEPLADGSLTGTIALVDRGVCPFVDKAANVQAAGAVALVVVNNAPGTISMGGNDPSVVIPAVMVDQTDGATIRAGLPAAGAVLANDPPAICGDGLHMIDVNDPTNPTFAGCEDLTDYVHDTQCVTYDGPDTRYTGREICFNSNGVEYALNGENYLSIVDVTDKSDPVVLSRLEYDGSGYSHQGWLTEDAQYFLHGDEGDEILAGVNTTTRVWDVSDLEAPEVVDVFVNDTTSIDHNIYTRGDNAYASNYTTGLRVYDVSDVASDGPVETAFIDLYPENDNASFEGGAWSNYPYFDREGVVAVSSIDRGLFIVRAKGVGDDD